MLSALVSIVVLSLAVASATMTITKATIFRPLRDWTKDKSDFFGELVNCPYCTSHYLAAFAVAIFQPVVVVSGVLLVDLVVSAYAIVTLSSLLCGLIYKSIASIK